MPPLLAALEAYPPVQLWTLAAKKTLTDAAAQFQKGSVTDIRWAGQEELEFVHGESGQHRTLLRLKDGRVAWACNRCSRQPCGHSLASMMLAGYLLRGSSAFGVPAGELATNVLRKRLRREDKEPRDRPRVPSDAARSNPASSDAMKRAFDRLLGKEENSLLEFADGADGDGPLPGYRMRRPLSDAVRGKVLLTPGGVGYTSQIFSYHRASMSRRRRRWLTSPSAARMRQQPKRGSGNGSRNRTRSANWSWWSGMMGRSRWKRTNARAG